MTIFLVLPAYNEEKCLAEVLGGFQRQAARLGKPAKVIIVDDGSSDGTRRIAESWTGLPVDLAIHQVNRGLGEAIRDGLRRAADSAAPDDVIVSMDADNTQPVDLIPAMIQRLDGGYELVIASRFRKGARVVGLSVIRRWMTAGARVLFQLALPIPGVRDYTCGFRAYRASLLQRAFARYGANLVEERGFACMAEILIKIGNLEASITEVPMVLRYDLKEGASKMPVSRTVARTLELIARSRKRQKSLQREPRR